MTPAHKDIVELIPWYTNGTLGAGDRARIEKHMNECLPCRAALREEQRLRRLIRAQDDVPLTAAHGISSLLRKIDAKRRPPPPFRSQSTVMLGAAVCAAVFAIWFLVTGPTSDVDNTSASYSTLTDSSTSEGNRIDIVFADSTREDEIRQIIEDIGAELVDGPSDLGRYTIVVDSAGDELLTQLIERLSEDPRVVFAGRNYIASPLDEAVSQ